MNYEFDDCWHRTCCKFYSYINVRTLDVIMKINKKGFTAVELLISLAILSMTLGSIYSLYMSFIRQCTNEGVKINVQQSVRSSLDMMTRDIRMAGLESELRQTAGVSGRIKMPVAEMILSF